ncbi:MAG: glycerate kinase, partial [Verrucomicrobiota bacterium]
MRILIAPDKFKGSMTAREASDAIRDALPKDWEAICLPIADGGEGTSEALTDALSGEWVNCNVRDPLGRIVDSGYGLVVGPPKTAILEMSHASGLWRLQSNELDPWHASTFGTGELICDAVRRGAKRILLGLGGSATNDGGSGMAKALGVRFLDGDGTEVESIPGDLAKVRRIDRSERLELPEFSAACDVSNLLLGMEGASRVYGPQKGVSES